MLEAMLVASCLAFAQDEPGPNGAKRPKGPPPPEVREPDADFPPREEGEFKGPREGNDKKSPPNKTKRRGPRNAQPGPDGPPNEWAPPDMPREPRRAMTPRAPGMPPDAPPPPEGGRGARGGFELGRGGPGGGPVRGLGGMPGDGPVDGRMDHGGPMPPEDPILIELMTAERQLDQDSHRLAHELKRAGADQKDQLKSRLGDVVRAHFEARQKRRKYEIEKLEGELKKLREAVEKREKGKESLVNRRISELSGEGDWDF